MMCGEAFGGVKKVLDGSPCRAAPDKEHGCFNARWRDACRASIIVPPPCCRIYPKLTVSSVHVPQTLTIAEDDLARAGESEYTLVVKLRKCS